MQGKAKTEPVVTVIAEQVERLPDGRIVKTGKKEVVKKTGEEAAQIAAHITPLKAFMGTQKT